MKKEAVSFMVAVLFATVLLGIAGIFVIRSTYENEIHTVQNLAGKVITFHPETEITFMEAVGDMERRDVDTGAKILERYGYDEQERIGENPSYRHAVIGYIIVLIMLCLTFLLCLYLFFHADIKRKKRQEEQLLSVLDCCLTGDYRFVHERKMLEELDNPLFADMLVKLGNSLKLKTQRLEEEQDNTKKLVTDISHQLKTPISALEICFSIYSETDNQAEKEEFFQRCRMQMDKLKMLAAALINVSRLENHMITLQAESVPLTEILVDAVNTVYHKAIRKQIVIEMTEFEEIRLCIDKKWTIEAIANVLDNAVKYSPVKGRVMIRVQKLYNYVRIEIEDNGIGILKEEQNQIFKRFYRGSSDIVRREEGSGIGLYLSRKILEEEGGTISVRPAKEKGSIFVIHLSL